jgi:zinc/manganese transport system substrate-binding protein
MKYIILLITISLSMVSLSAADSPLNICVTVTDIGAITREIGGDKVKVTVFAKGHEDPHSIEARPSFVRALADADLFIQTGLELEVGWAPVLLKNARNDKVLPGAAGFLEVASAIAPLDVPMGVVDRSLGDVHPGGNPHFLNDPVSGFRAAKLIEGKLAQVSAENAAYFALRYTDFAKRLGERLFGVELTSKYDPSKLAQLVERGKLMDFLNSQKDDEKIGGWLGEVKSFKGRSVVADHTIWPYFSRTFSFDVVGYLEPKPGIPPTTRHLQELIAMMKKDAISVILTTPFFDPKHAHVVAEKSASYIAAMAHQVGSLTGTDDYISFIDHNVKALVGAFAGNK